MQDYAKDVLFKNKIFSIKIKLLEIFSQFHLRKCLFNKKNTQFLYKMTLHSILPYKIKLISTQKRKLYMVHYVFITVPHYWLLFYFFQLFEHCYILNSDMNFTTSMFFYFHFYHIYKLSYRNNKASLMDSRIVISFFIAFVLIFFAKQACTYASKQ